MLQQPTSTLRKCLVKQISQNTAVDLTFNFLPSAVQSAVASLVSTSCLFPTNKVGKAKIIKASKRLRKTLSLDEGLVCAACPQRRNCAFASKPADDRGSFVNDVVRIVAATHHISDHAHTALTYFQQLVAEPNSSSAAAAAVLPATPKVAARIRRELAERKKSEIDRGKPELPEYVVSVLPELPTEKRETDETGWVDEDQVVQHYEQLPEKEPRPDPLVISDPKQLQRVVAFEGRLVKATRKLDNLAKRINAQTLKTVSPSEATFQTLQEILKIDRSVGKEIYQAAELLPSVVKVTRTSEEVTFIKRIPHKSPVEPVQHVSVSTGVDGLRREIEEARTAATSKKSFKSFSDFNFSAWTTAAPSPPADLPAPSSRQHAPEYVAESPAVNTKEPRVVVERLPVKNTQFVNAAILPLERVRTDSLRKFMRKRVDDEDTLQTEKAAREQRKTEAALKQLLARRP